MARIRCIKPELFRHEGLFDLEKSTGFNMRIAFPGLWSVCDAHGRFEWRPRALKSQVMPYDDCDFADVLEALRRAGFVRRYEVDGEAYGVIPSWHRHQRITGKEATSGGKYPPPPVAKAGHTGETPEKHPGNDGETPEKHPGAQEQGTGNREQGKEFSLRSNSLPPPPESFLPPQDFLPTNPADVTALDPPCRSEKLWRWFTSLGFDEHTWREWAENFAAGDAARFETWMNDARLAAVDKPELLEPTPDKPQPRRARASDWLRRWLGVCRDNFAAKGPGASVRRLKTRAEIVSDGNQELLERVQRGEV